MSNNILIGEIAKKVANLLLDTTPNDGNYKESWELPYTIGIRGYWKDEEKNIWVAFDNRNLTMDVMDSPFEQDVKDFVK